MAIFVVQKHKARNLHYDFRIEVNGVLKSWAIPKGPSMDTKVKRLAIPVDDHDIEYADFEGEIPEGEYGAGKVIVWDKGTYEHITKEEGDVIPIEKAMAKGHFNILLKGKKLKGKFAMLKTKMGWLLVKKSDEHVSSEDILKDSKSVISGKELEEI